MLVVVEEGFGIGGTEELGEIWVRCLDGIMRIPKRWSRSEASRGRERALEELQNNEYVADFRAPRPGRQPSAQGW